MTLPDANHGSRLVSFASPIARDLDCGPPAPHLAPIVTASTPGRSHWDGLNPGGWSLPDGTLHCTCWCGRTVVTVTRAMVLRGVTKSCHRPKCLNNPITKAAT